MEKLGADAGMDELLAVLAHDINNPLAALVTNLSFLESAVLPLASEDAAEALSDARLLCDMLGRLASNLDLLAMRGGSEHRQSKLDLGVLVPDVVTRLDAQARASDVSLKVADGLSRDEAFVVAERELVVRALENLVAFAIQRAASGTVIEVGAARVQDRSQVQIRFSSRAEEPVSLASDASPAMRRKWVQSMYGRGLVLYCGRLAASFFGADVLVQKEADGRALLSLVASAGERG